VRWSVGIQAQADHVLTREEVVELADAVASHDGIATGIGTDRYGAQLVVTAAGREEAIAAALEAFAQARAAAGLPNGQVLRVDAISEDDEAP
jgi:hypothetical protein